MFEVQQPYMPVCLMSAAVAGTEYYYHLYSIRKFRNKILLGQMGLLGMSLTDSYYGLSRKVSGFIYSNKTVKSLVLHLFVRPIGYISKKLL